MSDTLVTVNGGNIDALVSAIASNGAATYVVNGTLEVDKSVTISTNNVTVMTNYGGDENQPVTFKYMNNAGCIVVTGTGVKFDRCRFAPSNTASFYGIMVNIRVGTKVCIDTCAFSYGTGCAVCDDSGIFTYIIDPIFRGYNRSAGAGVTLRKLDSTLNTRRSFAGSIIGKQNANRGFFDGYIGVNIIDAEGWFFSDWYCNGATYGVYFNANGTSDGTPNTPGIVNMIFSRCHIVNCHVQGCPITTWSNNLNATIQNVVLYECELRCASDGYFTAVNFNHYVDWINICGGTIYSTGTPRVTFNRGYSSRSVIGGYTSG